MTEQEWLTETSPLSLLTAKRTVPGPNKVRLLGVEVVLQMPQYTHLMTLTSRKTRLFVVACCRRATELISPKLIDFLSEVERMADSPEPSAKPPSLTDAVQKLEAFHRADYRPGEVSVAKAVLLTADTDLTPVELGMNVANYLACAKGEVAHPGCEDRWPPEVEAAHDAEKTEQCMLFRDIYHNPFQPVRFRPQWLTPLVVSVAQRMYESRDFSTMPILADALQDAGCDNEHILCHCRDTSAAHVRGCWVVDLVLGKE